jgi:nucleotide-binding universal stress UspA family protein
MNENQIPHGTTSILLCLDLEEGSRELAEFCKDCAEHWNYPVHVIHVHGDGGRDIEDVEPDLSVITDEILYNLRVPAVKILKGLPEEAIVEFANEITSTPIIMLGRRKRRIADRIYVGSTTSAVISLSTYPVLVVPLNTLK